MPETAFARLGLELLLHECTIEDDAVLEADWRSGQGGIVDGYKLFGALPAPRRLLLGSTLRLSSRAFTGNYIASAVSAIALRFQTAECVTGTCIASAVSAIAYTLRAGAAHFWRAWASRKRPPFSSRLLPCAPPVLAASLRPAARPGPRGTANSPALGRWCSPSCVGGAHPAVLVPLELLLHECSIEDNA